jgi:hypothetical protein
VNVNRANAILRVFCKLLVITLGSGVPSLFGVGEAFGHGKAKQQRHALSMPDIRRCLL